VLGKLYCTILAARLSKAAEQIEQAMCNEQGGFHAGRSQSEQLYVLLETIHTRRHRKRRLYALFVDIKKAYDRVHRTGLWVCLWACGIRSKMLRVLRNLHEDVKSPARSGSTTRTLPGWFELAEGLRQGCMLSPLLCAIKL
jgi:Reverse transcriptase (RNA-dependent DNA polymerase)